MNDIKEGFQGSSYGRDLVVMRNDHNYRSGCGDVSLSCRNISTEGSLTVTYESVDGGSTIPQRACLRILGRQE